MVDKYLSNLHGAKTHAVLDTDDTGDTIHGFAEFAYKKVQALVDEETYGLSKLTTSAGIVRGQNPKFGFEEEEGIAVKSSTDTNTVQKSKPVVQNVNRPS